MNNQNFNTYKLNKYYLIIGENMNESFKINIYFDEEGESLENLIEHLIMNILDINESTLQYMKRNINIYPISKCD